MRRLALLGSAICVLFAFALAAAAEDKAKSPAKPAEKPAAAKKTLVVKLTLSGEYPEGSGEAGLLGEAKPTLSALISKLDDAAADKDVAAVWLKIEGLAIGRGKLAELRAAVERIRKAGKPVLAELTTAGSADYLLAAACDRIVMPPSGMLIVPGVRMEMMFYKGLLDKLGLQFEPLQMGKYKGAAEPLSRKDMSQPLRESLEAIVEDCYQDMLATVAADRKLKDYEVKTFIDRGLFSAADAKKAGLIDELLYADQLQDQLRETIKAEKLEFVANYKSKKVDADFSGIAGLMKLVELMMGGKPKAAAGDKPKIAVVYAVGPIMEGKSSDGGLFGSQSVGSTTLTAALRKAAEDKKVAAVVLRIDSPGGSAVASDLIWRETVRMQKPLIASMGDVAGSGGYYIAMGAKKIFAAPGTLTGSIGVIGGKLVTRGLYEKLGLNIEVIARGANSGSLSTDHPFTPEERKAWVDLLEETYRQFVGKAAEGRKMTYNQLEALAQGRVYSGLTAKKLGLVDELGTLADALAAAKKEAGLKPDAEVELMVLPEPKSFFEQLFGDPSASELESLLPTEWQLLRQANALRALLSQRVLAWMPFDVKIK
jgi:protease-4